MSSIGEKLTAIADEISRLQNDETDIRSALSRKGVDATGHGMDDYAADIDSIQTGGGGGTDVSDTTAVASDVLADKIFHTANGARTEGTIKTIAPFIEALTPTKTQYELDSAYYRGGTIMVSSHEEQIDNSLLGTGLSKILDRYANTIVYPTEDTFVPENIKQGISIFGKVGTFAGGGGGATDTVVIDKNTPNPLIIDTGIKDLKMFDIKIDRVGYEGSNCFSSTTYYSDNPTHYTASYHYSNTNGSGNTYALNGSQNANFFVVNSVVDGVVSLKPLSSSSWYGTATWTAM